MLVRISWNLYEQRGKKGARIEIRRNALLMEDYKFRSTRVLEFDVLMIDFTDRSPVHMNK